MVRTHSWRLGVAPAEGETIAPFAGAGSAAGSRPESIRTALAIVDRAPGRLPEALRPIKYMIISGGKPTYRTRGDRELILTHPAFAKCAVIASAGNQWAEPTPESYCGAGTSAGLDMYQLSAKLFFPSLGDHQRIHVDPESRGLFSAPINHDYLTHLFNPLFVQLLDAPID
ncbi:hypothetical protein [Streptomyces chartreusis]|uniref:hypothetical protein n=1 Tax=Streptomyces chartreusis TaxID=1969 RepID=UPI00364A66B1